MQDIINDREKDLRKQVGGRGNRKGKTRKMQDSNNKQQKAGARKK